MFRFVIVPGLGEPDCIPVRKLLPGAHRFPDARPERLVRFNPAYFERVRDGLKTQTVRFDDPAEGGHAWPAFEFDDGYRRLPGVIEQVTTRRLNDLDDDDARREGASSIAALRAGSGATAHRSGATPRSRCQLPRAGR